MRIRPYRAAPAPSLVAPTIGALLVPGAFYAVGFKKTAGVFLVLGAFGLSLMYSRQGQP